MSASSSRGRTAETDGIDAIFWAGGAFRANRRCLFIRLPYRRNHFRPHFAVHESLHSNRLRATVRADGLASIPRLARLPPQSSSVKIRRGPSHRTHSCGASVDFTRRLKGSNIKKVLGCPTNFSRGPGTGQRPGGDRHRLSDERFNDEPGSRAKPGRHRHPRTAAKIGYGPSNPRPLDSPSRPARKRFDPSLSPRNAAVCGRGTFPQEMPGGARLTNFARSSCVSWGRRVGRAGK